MGVADVALVVMTTLLITFTPIWGVTDWDDTSIHRITSANDNTVVRSHVDTTVDRRQLRNSDVTERDDLAENEQRNAFSTGLAQVAGITASYTLTAQKLTLMTLLHVNMRPKDVFNLLKLNQLKLTKNTATTLEENSALLEWLKYSVAYRTKMGDDMWYSNDKIYFKLLKLAPEAELAKFFQVLRNNPELKSVGDELQLVQYKMWSMAGLEPSDLDKFLRMTTSVNAKNSIYFGYTQYWLSLVKP
ncbi:Avirulence protein (Avh) [Phytophthora palmivora]|uniref:Avirulence protein (Avh) n=1 Tax=Phytophthora palmivora TaxID=4796 RepID=A0A2P4Y880_9STRA|nr:Avirulence protein (Avh) [Phytophthora palmivora]